MSLKRRLRSRSLTRVLVPAAVLSLTVALTAVPADAVYVPPNDPATLVSANPADFTPHAQNGSMRAFAQIGNTVYAGGSFTGIKAAGATDWTPLSNLVAYNATTGALDAAFAPVLDGAVQTLAVSPDGKLIVGGSFGTVNGVARKNLVELDPATGATVPGWVGRADGGTVRRAIVQDNYLYIAGAFHWVNGTEHSLLARLDVSTGAIDPTFQIDASGARPYADSTELVWGLAVAPDGDTVVAVGNFTSVNGNARNQVVMIDTAGTPAVANWNTTRYVPGCSSGTFPFYARDVDFSDDGEYFVIIADGGYSTSAYCDATVRWETSDRGSNVTATWVDYTGGDSVTSVEVADGVVYVGGHFRWQNNANGADSQGDGGVSRYGVAALDQQNGVPLAWNPTRSPGTQLPVGGTDWGPIVWELWKGPNGLFLGQDSDGLGNEYHGRQGYFPETGGRTIGIQDAPQSSSGYLYLGAGDGQLTKVPYGATGLGTPSVVSQPNLTAARSAFVVGNKLYWAKSTNDLNISVLSNAGAIGVSWVGSGYNDWYSAYNMRAAFYLQGRMYYTTSTSNSLFYRYLTPDGYIIGCTQFTLPTSGVNWRNVRGMTWVAGKLVYGSTDGSLRTVNFDPAATTAVVGSTATVVASPTTATTWNNSTLFFATS